MKLWARSGCVLVTNSRADWPVGQTSLICKSIGALCSIIERPFPFPSVGAIMWISDNRNNDRTNGDVNTTFCGLGVDTEAPSFVPDCRTGNRTSREAPIEVEFLSNCVPCMHPNPAISESIRDAALFNSGKATQTGMVSLIQSESNSGKEKSSSSLQTSNPTVSSTQLALSRSESTVSHFCAAESYMYDETAPPPAILANSTSSDTEDDDNSMTEGTQITKKRHSHTDPFAPREGKTLCWRNVNMTLVSLVDGCLYKAG